MTKKELRTIYKQKRLEIEAREKLKLDDLLLLQLQTFNFEGVQTLLTYWPMANMVEPNTHLFSGYLRHFVPDLQIAYPVCDFGCNNMTAILIDEDTVYTTNKFGVTEPKEGNAIHAIDLDLVFVPNLICDKQGYRVGYGKGFYDRFLAACSENVTLMGFNYFAPVEIITDTNDFDIPLNYCITPEEVFEF
ncbi:5-formyltetrahydrofolate cyclo-ligase [Parasediminibacterium sp. JCM 36343]|uniref:5-formyltetrahydrofolate cyclo-ligase n=1 Tax=Parasediminibacterium sp. JCM 36343 TaxID=3374279 RepID=UPI00397BE697